MKKAPSSERAQGPSGNDTAATAAVPVAAIRDRPWRIMGTIRAVAPAAAPAPSAGDRQLDEIRCTFGARWEW